MPMIKPKPFGIVHEHDVFRRGIEGSLAEDAHLSVRFALAENPPSETVLAAVVSGPRRPRAGPWPARSSSSTTTPRAPQRSTAPASRQRSRSRQSHPTR
jgi:hypothetical protein